MLTFPTFMFTRPSEHSHQPSALNLMLSRYLFFLLLLLPACKGSPTDEEYLARVGNRTLTAQDIKPTLDATAYQQDSSEALQQIVEGWIKDELIAQEAIRRGLRNDSEVQRLLEENERQVLVSAFINKLIQDNLPIPADEEIEAYYAQNMEQLALRDDYLRVRYIGASSLEDANQLRITMRDATVEGTLDIIWEDLVSEYAQDQDASLILASRFHPKSILFSSAQLNAIVGNLDVNQISAVHQEGDTYHVIQLAERMPAGSIPTLDLIKEEIKERLTIDTRKQLVARQVQRLRTEALAQEDLEIRYLDE